MITKHKSSIVTTLLVITLCFNILDAILTVCWVGWGIAKEVNPLWQPILAFNASVFMFLKVFLVALCCGLIWLQRKSRVALLASVLCCLLSLYIVYQYHLPFIEFWMRK